MNQNKNKIRVLGAVLSYAVEGTGIPCIVMGLGTYTARLLSQNLRRHFQFIITDFRGLGISDDKVDISTITLCTLLEDIEAIRRHLGHERIAVLGLSICGTVALDYALAFPEHLTHLVLLCAPPCWTKEFRDLQITYMATHLPPERRVILERNRRSLADATGDIPREQEFLKQYVAQSPLYWYDPEFNSTPFWRGIHINMDFVLHFDTPAYFGHDLTEHFSDLNMPVFLALGKHDYATPPTAWDNYCDRLPDLTMHLFEQSSHHPTFEEQELFDQALVEWYESRI